MFSIWIVSGSHILAVCFEGVQVRTALEHRWLSLHCLPHCPLLFVIQALRQCHHFVSV